MKLSSILFFSVIIVCHATAQPLFSFGKNTVSKDEFLRQFNRNLNPNEDRSNAMQAYLPLYINYKLKVQDAYDKRLDTSGTQKQELSDFRRQIEENYFSELANVNTLVDEAFLRSQKDIRLQDILIGFDPKDGASITLAEETAKKAMQKLNSGTTFDNALYEFCTDNGFRANKGDLGWVTVFSLPYKMENEVYNLPLGKYSQPIKMKTAFHIIKKTDERKALGRLRVAQILLSYQPGANDDAKTLIKTKADSLRNLIMHGANFEEMARNLSNDKTSYMNGGALPEFGVGTYDAVFENAAFALQKNGEISQPIASSFGVHILKLLEKIPVIVDAKNTLNLSNLKQHIISDNRMEIAKTNLTKTLLQKIGYQPNITLNKKLLWQFCDSSIKGAALPKVLPITSQTELFKYAKQSYKAADFLKYFRAMNDGKPSTETEYNNFYESYQSLTTADFYKAHMEEYSPDFKAQLQEFKDANLNFEVTEKMVWNKAANDSIGLAKYYASNKNKYQWGPSVNAIIFTSTDTAVTSTARAELLKDISLWRLVAAKYDNKLLADSNRFEQSQIPILPTAKFILADGRFTPTVPNLQDHSETFCYIVKKMDEPGQRSFTEARGFVINDYQQVLENQWLDILKKKYPVVVNQAVLQALLKK